MLSWLKNDKRGFTLVEMVVSVLILGIVTVTMIGVFMIARVSIVKAKHYMQAMNHARAKMEDLKNQDYSSITRGTSSVTVDYPYQISIESPSDTPPFIIDWGGDFDGDGNYAEEDGDELKGYRITQVEPIGSPEEYLKVTVIVTWSGYRLGGGSSSVSEELATLISE